MASVLGIETYQVFADNGGSITVLSPDYNLRETAVAQKASIVAAVAAGTLTIAGVIDVRATPGSQSISVTEPVTQASLLADLADKTVEVILFARTNDGTDHYTRLGALTKAKVFQMDP